jgi:hypothetical protein
MSYENDIDKMTIELLMNKTQFNKYLSKTDPKRAIEQTEFIENIRKHKRQILHLTNQLLENPANPVTTEVNDAFELYVKTLIRHFKTKEIERANEYNRDDDDESATEDVMFENMDEEPVLETEEMRSFWGKDRVKKKPTPNVSAFAMGIIPRKLDS